jgi:SNF2 family DNA or RNA helicase
LTNWAKELQRFAPELSLTTYHGKDRSNLNTNDITLITYGTVRRDIEKINKHKWDLLVIDEAQNIKNLSSQQTKLVKSIKSKYRIAMSGTPVENRLLEYYSIMDFANKGYLGGVTHFNKQFAKPIESERDIQQLNKFLLATKPFVLRRLKNDKSIIQDLPDKTVIDEYCTLRKAQVALYQATLNSIMEKLKFESDEMARRGLVLTLIMALKQICNHPGQYLKQFDNINIEDSGKLLFLLDKLKDIYANQEKVLIFTQFSEMGTILQEVIEKYCNTPVLFLQGSTTRKKRDEMVELIQNDPQHQTMILSIKAGGVGLNLTGANHVIHYDLWWNPAVENQATDRAYRIGQNKNVFVHRLVCSNSFEEKINQMIRDKQDLANLTVATGEQWIGNLSDKELKQIFTLNADFNDEFIDEKQYAIL